MYITIHNRKIHYKQFGKGPPLILLHGWGQNSYNLHELAQAASSGFAVYILDLPGFGKSDMPPRHWGIDGYVFLVKEFMQKKGIKQAHVMGFAFGASIGIMLAAKHKKLLQSLTILSCPLHQPPRQNSLTNIAPQHLRNNAALNYLYKQLRGVYLRFFHIDSDLRQFPHLESHFRRIISHDLSCFLSSVRVPTLILWGEDDKCTPVIFAYEIQNKIQNSELFIIPKAEHDILRTDPHTIWKEMKRFLLS